MFRATYDEAHEIVPRLFLGSYEAARDFQFLSAHSVTHVVSVHTGAEPLFPGKLKYMCISVDDAPYEDLLSHFSTTSHFIQRGLDAGGAVLVHWYVQ
ncbi:dual specificity phosphatase 19 [Dimargaris xerosporica]|nr:dual specificity phosphatase 19 [Dimargaris xerosporica]